MKQILYIAIVSLDVHPFWVGEMLRFLPCMWASRGVGFLSPLGGADDSRHITKFFLKKKQHAKIK